MLFLLQIGPPYLFMAGQLGFFIALDKELCDKHMRT